ncbi:unnamed protein product [Trichobilharzia regenti]|nr:unnamed protein product [Trichobilharzia regenti]
MVIREINNIKHTMTWLKSYLPYFAITLGSSFPFGYQSGVINAPAELIKNFINSTFINRMMQCDKQCINLIWSICVTFFVVGGFLGGFIGGIFANKFGRKKSLLLLSIPTIIGSLLMLFSKASQSFEMIIVGRFIVGIACGAHTVVGPMYLSEIAPVSFRGAAGTLNQLVVVCAILLSQVLGLPEVMGTDELWPYLLALVSLRGDDCDIQCELEILKREMECSLTRRAKISDLLRVPYLRWSLITALIPHIGQQFSGINGVSISFL